jgi:hypothetical protein
VSKYEAPSAYILDKDYFVILPLINTYRDYSVYSHLEKVEFESFDSSNAKQLNDTEFESMLKGDGWLKSNIDTNELKDLSKEEIIQYFRVS